MGIRSRRKIDRLAHTLAACVMVTGLAGCGTPGIPWAWGNNESGELGVSPGGVGALSALPVRVQKLSGVMQLAGGYDHSLALRSDGTVWAWGTNWAGQLGNGTADGAAAWNGPSLVPHPDPEQIGNLNGVVQVAAGWSWSMALRFDGTVWTWGLNDYGQLGNGSTNDSPSPIQVPGVSSITQVSAGNGHALALTSDGKVLSWGTSAGGILGTGSLMAVANPPTQIQGLDHVTQVVAVQFGSWALTSDGRVWGWGLNNVGQLGPGSTVAESFYPVQIAGLSDVVQIASALNNPMALKSDGTVWTWGEFSVSGSTPHPVAVQVPGLDGVTQLALGSQFAFGLALRSDGTVWAWGTNDNGQLGNGVPSSATPQPPLGVTEVLGLPGKAVAIAAGLRHALAIVVPGPTIAPLPPPAPAASAGADFCGVAPMPPPGSGHGRGDACVCGNGDQSGVLVCSADRTSLICCPCNSAPGCGPGSPPLSGPK
jgi:alpha-tubulin suppressor-like RCC1 family protein